MEVQVDTTLEMKQAYRLGKSEHTQAKKGQILIAFSSIQKRSEAIKSASKLKASEKLFAGNRKAVDTAIKRSNKQRIQSQISIN